MPSGSIVHLQADSIEQLRPAYLPFIQGGGLLIPLGCDCALGTELIVALELTGGQQVERLDEKQGDTSTFVFHTQVVWVNPNPRGDKKNWSVGVQIANDEMATRLAASFSASQALPDSTRRLW